MTALDLIKSRDADTMQALMLFLRDERALRVIAAWPTIEHQDIDRPLKKNEGFKQAYDAMWAAANVDMAELADQADVPLTRCERIFPRLKKARIIYPDGTISTNASNLLVTTSIAYMRSQRGGKSHDASRVKSGGADVPKSDEQRLPAGPAPASGTDKGRHPPDGRSNTKAR